MQTTSWKRVLCGLFAVPFFVGGLIGATSVVNATMIYSFNTEPDRLLEQVDFRSPVDSSSQLHVSIDPLSVTSSARLLGQLSTEPQSLRTLMAQRALKEWATQPNSRSEFQFLAMSSSRSLLAASLLAAPTTWEPRLAAGHTADLKNCTIGSLESARIRMADRPTKSTDD